MRERILSPEPSPGQRRVLDFIREYIERQRMPPTRAEIARGLGFNSPNAVQDHLNLLARKGLVELLPGISRGIRLPASTSEGRL